MPKGKLFFTVLTATVAFSAFSATALAKFSDVPSNHPYAEAIEFVQQTGIVEGYEDGTFKPDQVINRAEFTKIVIGAYYLPEDWENCFQGLIKFTDTPGDWYAPYLCVAIGDGIIGGYPDNTFRPANPINYVEAAKIISIGAATVIEEEFNVEEGEAWFTPYTESIANKKAKPGSIKNNEQTITRGEMAHLIFKIDEDIANKINEGSHTDEGAQDPLESTAETEYFIAIEASSADECYEDEIYDAESQMCLIPCADETECDAIEKEIIAAAEEIGEDYYDGDKTYQPVDDHGGPADFDQPNHQDEADSFITYTIKDNQITNPVNGTASTDEIKKHQADTAKHQAIWKRFSALIPEANRKMFVSYQLFTDGKEGTMAAVTQDQDDPTKWVLLIDIVDAYPDGNTMDKTDLTYSLIHEYGHVLTLGNEQIPADTAVFGTTETTEEQFAQLLVDQTKKCQPNFYLQEGCSKTNSYINKFFQAYWKTIYYELPQNQNVEDETKLEEIANNFYEKYQSQFVTDYAATNPGEDIAESWTAFILKEKPTGNTIADQKVQFFYNFPELVELRKVIRARL